MAKKPSKPESSRAISLTTYLTRHIPWWGHPGWMEAERWRQVVRNQPIAVICRDTLIMNLLSMDWSIAPRDTEDGDKKKTKKDIEWYTDMFTKLEGDFDNYLELVCQDLLDLPFGAAAEVYRNPDSEDGDVIWAEHIDGATLYPTLDDDFPVMQKVPEIIDRIVTFPSHAIERIFMTPRTEIKRKGWGMAPPEKIYLGLEMLYRGDRYYANLLLDTPEAGILDLMDFSEKNAKEWLSSTKELFQGIDGMKVPVLYEHKVPAKWIPLNRPPIDMLYDKTTIKYAQIVAAGYGMRLSDIGMSELGGEKTLAGVIRGERQTRRSGFALVRSKMANHFNSLLPKHLKWVWEEKDEESQVARGRALQTVGQALSTLTQGMAPLMSAEEARQELVATGLLEVDIDPKKLPEVEQDSQPFPFGQPGADGMGQFAGAPGGNKGGGQGKNGGGKVPPAQGGRGQGFMSRTFDRLTGRDRVPDEEVDDALAPAHEGPESLNPERLLAMMDEIVGPGLRMIPEAAQDVRLRRLIKAATRAMVPSVERIFVQLSDDQIDDYWLSEMNKLEFEQESILDSITVRQTQNEIREQLEIHLEDDPWWRVASEWDKIEILEVYAKAYTLGIEEQAINILRSLYEEGLASRPYFGPAISFDLVNVAELANLEATAADFVTFVDDGTKYFLKRIISAGVRKGLSSPRIAAAIRDGAKAEALLRDDGFVQEAINEIKTGMIEMTEARANSITNFEIKKAANKGHLDQLVKSGLKMKAWVHLGERGTTDSGNEHPCPFCSTAEDAGFVKNDFMYKSVFKKGGDDDKGGILHPPAHPGVCHCRIIFDEKELFDLVGKGEYTPWTGD